MCAILTLQSCTQIKVPFQVPLWYNSPCNHRGESTTKVPFLFQMMEKVTSKEKPSSFQRTVAETLDLSAFELTCRSSASAVLRKPCHGGPRRGPSARLEIWFFVPSGRSPAISSPCCGVLLLLAGLACPNYDTNNDACQCVSYDIYDK